MPVDTQQEHVNLIAKPSQQASLAQRLDRIVAAEYGQALPVRVLFLAGWSPGPGLPESLTHLLPGDNLSQPLFDCLSRSLNCCESYLVWVRLEICRAANGCLIRRAARLFSKEVDVYKPTVVFGYSWGGAIAVAAMQKKLWTGPCLLLNPTDEMLMSHACRKRKASLKGVQAKNVFIVASEGDILTGGDARILRLAASATDSRESMGEGVTGASVLFLRDDHMLSSATSRDVQGWVVRLLGTACGEASTGRL